MVSFSTLSISEYARKQLESSFPEPELILLKSIIELKKLTNLREEELKKAVQEISQQIANHEHLTALDILKRENQLHDDKNQNQNQGNRKGKCVIGKLGIGERGIDEFLKGGIVCGGITEIFGESASGKTQFVLSFALSVQLPIAYGGLNSKAVYISTEDGFPNKRLFQLISHFKEKYDFLSDQDLASNIYTLHAFEIEDFDQVLHSKLPSLLEKNNVRLVIIDSLAALFRGEFTTQMTNQRAMILFKFASKLKKLADDYTATIICINQVNDNFNALDFSSTKFVPTLGLAWSNCINTRIMLSRESAYQNENETSSSSSIKREMSIIFSPHLPPSSHSFQINETGLSSVS